MIHESDMDTKFIRGLVLDHGGRHPDMPKHVENAYILTCNVSLEFEKTEVNSGLFYKTAAERERLLQAEREYITRRVHKIIELKKKVCDEAEKEDGKKRGFVVINQKVRIWKRLVILICSFRASILLRWMYWHNTEFSLFDVLSAVIWNACS
jgi:T-complex protein 1 subunit zeta